MAYDPDSLGEATDQIAQAGLVRFEVHLAGNKSDDVAMIEQIYNDINIPNPPAGRYSVGELQRYVIDRLFTSAMDAVKVTIAGAYKWAYENHGEESADQLLNALRDFVGPDDDDSTA